MGRVLRRYRQNFNYDGEPNVKILIFSEGYESGNGKVYHKELIETTKSILINFAEESSATIEQLRAKIISSKRIVKPSKKSRKKKNETKFRTTRKSVLDFRISKI